MTLAREAQASLLSFSRDSKQDEWRKEFYFKSHVFAYGCCDMSHPRYSVEALLCLGRILYAQAKYEEGNQQFVDGLEMLKRLNLHEEFAEQSASYAQLLSEQGKAQEAIAYYKLAFESHQKGRGF